MEPTIIAQVMCLALMSPEFHLNKSRQDLACRSIGQILEDSEESDVDPSLLIAVIFTESSWRKSAVSPVGACGLTQVIPKYTGGSLTGTRRYTCSQLKRPRNAIRAGSKILGFWINRYGNGNIKVGLCGYSSGFRCKGERPLKAGMRYALKVLKMKRKIDRIYKEKLSIYNRH
jgi:hypothetical protein